MASANPKFVISALSIDSVTWTPIVVPVPCNNIAVKVSQDVKIRTDSTDATTQDTIPNGAQEVVLAGYVAIQAGFVRFPPGTTVAFLQAVSGSPSVILRFIY